MSMEKNDAYAVEKLFQTAREHQLDIHGGKVRRSSSRFCLGVEHGDYNGTELFGVGTDRFIWLAYKPNQLGRHRFFSVNVPEEGVVEFTPGQTPLPKSPDIADAWARFPLGADYILRREGYNLPQTLDVVLYGNIPGGGMSRSASLSLNLILTLFDANAVTIDDKLKIVDLAQAIENDFIGSPCGQLDQIMILFARGGFGTHYNPTDRSIKYVPLGKDAADFRLMVMDTGTVRHGLEKSTYAVRLRECHDFVALMQKDGYPIKSLADVRNEKLYDEIMRRYNSTHSDWCKRLDYIFHAQQRFYKMLDAWRNGDIDTVGKIFRADGLGLRDDYVISGPELEAMCDIARSVPGVLGERMLGGGDKGASGAIVRADAVEALKAAVAEQYPQRCPACADKAAVHTLSVVDGITCFDLV
ncbi:MAG: hypothetical protein JW709_02605 [Sedimentisphaerales bacterium]|nr:hypothetical protein [Sedimentisphaerales bacterium]